MNKDYILELADKLEELLKSGNLVGNETRANSIIGMLQNERIDANQKGQFVAMAEKLVTGNRTANKNNYSGMLERLNSLLNNDSNNYLD